MNPDATVPHSARIWNYWMGGTDNYPVDREAGERYAARFPEIKDMARHSRRFLRRAVELLAGELDVRQFLDVGSGLPTHDNTHEVAQRVAPRARTVYVDNDPLVLVHARTLLTGTPQGTTDYVDADVRSPQTVLRAAAKTLDFSRPIALMLMGVMGHLADDEAYSVAGELVAALPQGSYLVERDGVAVDEELVEAQRGYDDTGAVPYHLRTPAQIARFFDGLELLEPGVVSCSRWRNPDEPAEVALYGGVARKP